MEAGCIPHKCLTAALPRPKANCWLIKESMIKEYNGPSQQHPKTPGGHGGYPSRVILVPRSPLFPVCVFSAPQSLVKREDGQPPLKSLDLFGPDYSKVNRSIWGTLGVTGLAPGLPCCLCRCRPGNFHAGLGASSPCPPPKNGRDASESNTKSPLPPVHPRHCWYTVCGHVSSYSR